MYQQLLEAFSKMSKTVGARADYIQGGGGNTSVKLSDELMAIKASGYSLNQITTDDGFVALNYKNIAAFYDTVDLSSGEDLEKKSGEVTKENICPLEGMQALRPSVEAGFHSIMKKFVIHTHSVYANILTCAKAGRDIAESIFSAAGIGFIWVPYINPGFSLTVEIKQQIEAYEAANGGAFPQVIFMQNHGVIVTDDDADAAVALHDKVNDLIRERLGLTGEFPKPAIKTVGEDSFVSDTAYIAEYVKANAVGKDYFDSIILYPDQLVYLNQNVAGEGKLIIDTATGAVEYHMGQKEAQTVEETMLAYFFVIAGVKKQGWDISVMTPEEIAFIMNWDSEKYRKALLAKQK
ncbi:MAG: class II aldolase [Clostridiales bacterium]|nr:class II aldolase [Clostridiales bacterium]